MRLYFGLFGKTLFEKEDLENRFFNNIRYIQPSRPKRVLNKFNILNIKYNSLGFNNNNNKLLNAIPGMPTRSRQLFIRNLLKEKNN